MEMKDLIADLKAKWGISQEQIEIDLSKVETKVEKNANEVEHITNTGYGQELVPVDVLTDKVLEVFPSFAKLMDLLMLVSTETTWEYLSKCLLKER